MKKLMTCIAAVLMAGLVTASGVCAASYSSFPDASGHWAAKYLQRAVESGTLTGSHGKLQPDGKLSGAQMTAIVTRDCGLNMWTKAYPGAASNEWYYSAAGAAYSVGLLPSDGSVSMRGNVTRSQVFEILAEAYMELDPSGDYSEPQEQPSDADGSMPPETSGHAAGTDGETEGETDGEAAEQPETAEPEQPVSVLSGFTDASSLEGKTARSSRAAR